MLGNRTILHGGQDSISEYVVPNTVYPAHLTAEGKLVLQVATKAHGSRAVRSSVLISVYMRVDWIAFSMD